MSHPYVFRDVSGLTTRLGKAYGKDFQNPLKRPGQVSAGFASAPPMNGLQKKETYVNLDFIYSSGEGFHAYAVMAPI